MEKFLTSFEFKEVDEAGTFEGYAAVFKNVDRQRDKILKGAFETTLEENGGQVPVLAGHDSGKQIGFGVGAKEDSHGLKVWGELTLDNTQGRDAHALAKHAKKLGQSMKMSIGYLVRKDGSEWDDKTGIRTLKDLDLWEYSFVAIPANPRARVTDVKQLVGDDDVTQWTIREFEKHLCEVGFSNQAACIIASRGFKALGGGDQRDSDGDESGLLTQLTDELKAFQLLTEIKELSHYVNNRH